MTQTVKSQTVQESTRSRRLPRWKAGLFIGLTAALVMGVVEVVSLLIWMIVPPVQHHDYWGNLRTAVEIGSERKNDLEVIHPYLGWVFNPDAAAIPTHLKSAPQVNSLGFSDTGPSIRRRGENRFVIGIFGGSVAQQLSTIGEEALRSRLAESDALSGREIQIVRLAMSGYKQPQQLIALNYLLALGGEFDVVVNIDGYNETALVVGENDLGNVFAAYPRMWDARLQDVVDPRTASISYRLLKIRATRQSRAQFFLDSMLCRTFTGSLLWATQEELLKQLKAELGSELRERSKKQGRGFARQGPRQMYSNPDEMYDHLADLWKNCSLQMRDLCAAKGIRYLHFLQPNQYLPGSKPLSPLELKKFYAPNETGSQAIAIGYPHLIAAGERLREAGVEFHNMTQLFSTVTDTIYCDYFCHYNTQGTNMLAEAVASKIVQAELAD